jgi:iron complex transport system substrate-binding protein
MAAGNWMPELVEMAGGENLFGRTGEHSPWMKFEELAAANPGVILLCPCGFNMDRTLEELPALTRNPAWPQLQAVRSRNVFVADGNQYFNRPGPRIVESLEILAEILHPERFSFGHEGRGWRRA